MRALGLLTLAVLTSAGWSAEPPRRNVLLLIADDLGLDLGCYGNPVVQTPNLDRLAADGTRFTHAFATVASCSPSRAVLLTGQYTHTNGQYGLAHATHHFHTFASVKSLPRLLKEAGYRTGVLGKLHVLPPSVYPFDVVQGGGRDVVRMAQQARRFFADEADRPFFLLIGYVDPHRAAKGFDNEKPYPGVVARKYDPATVRLPYFLSDRPEVRQEVAEYYEAISRLDQGVGMVLDALRETGQAGNTLVIFLSDNGMPFPGAKTTLYDAGTHLPLLVSSPKQKRRGVSSAAMVSWADVAPTILDWAGLQPSAMPGRSFLTALEEENPKGWDAVYGSHVFHEVTMYYPMRTIRTRQYRYLLNLAHQLPFPFASDLYHSATWQGILHSGAKTLGQRSLASFINRPREELYDLEKDPNELNNVAGDPGYARVLEELRSRVKQWQERTHDPWLVKYRYE